MAETFNRFFSVSSQQMKKSAIREILKLTQKPEMISYAVFCLKQKTFPIEDIKKITSEVLEHDGPAALQYGTTDGDNKLRSLLAERHKKDGLTLALNNICLLYTSPSPRDGLLSRMPSSA